MFWRTVAMRVSVRLIGVAAFAAWMGTLAAAQRGGGSGAPTPAPQERSQTSPASQRAPQTKVLQEYPAAQVEAGRTQFASQCGFCHGRDAAGGAGGTDLTRSTLVAEDVRGDRLAPVIRSGRPAQGMPAFALSDAELAAIVAIVNKSSGFPRDAAVGVDVPNTGAQTYRPNLVSGQDPNDGPQTVLQWFNTAAFARKSVQLRLEAFNLFNKPIWGDPDTNMSSSTYGRINTTRSPMHELQLGVKFAF